MQPAVPHMVLICTARRMCMMPALVHPLDSPERGSLVAFIFGMDPSVCLACAPQPKNSYLQPHQGHHLPPQPLALHRPPPPSEQGGAASASASDLLSSRTGTAAKKMVSPLSNSHHHLGPNAEGHGRQDPMATAAAASRRPQPVSACCAGTPGAPLMIRCWQQTPGPSWLSMMCC
jgi:hypothetical protein